MALAAPQIQDRPIAGQTNTSVHAARVGDVELGHAAQENITVTNLIAGQSVVVRNNIYDKTNFFIKQSRPYIPERKLRTYWYIRFMEGAFVVFCGLIGPMPFVPYYIGWPWALVVGAIGMVWLVILVQHAHVLCWTIPKVLSQPILSNSKQPGENAFYEVKIDRLEGIFLRAKDFGIGALAANSDNIKFQALNKTAATNIMLSALFSFAALITTIFALLLSVAIFSSGIAIDYSILAR